MTSRERILMLIVGGLAVLIACFTLVPLYFKNLNEARGRIEKAEAANKEKMALLQKEDKDIKRIQQVSPRLKDWKKLSLPEGDVKQEIDPTQREVKRQAHLSRMQIAYQQFLTDLLQQSGFRASVVSGGKYEDKFEGKQTMQSQAAKNKPLPLYTILPFTVEGQATMASIIKVFEGLHKTPLLHQVKSFTLSSKLGTSQRNARADDIKVTLHIEVLQVTGAEPLAAPGSKEATKPDARQRMVPSYSDKQPPPLVLASKVRNYEDMTAKNLFNLNPPKEEVKTEVKPVEPPPMVVERPREKKEDVLKFVRLTGIDYTEGIEGRSPAWEATLLNLNRSEVDETSGQTKMDVTRFRMYHDGNRMRIPDFRILDRFDNEVVKGEGVRIEPRGVLLLVDRKVYRLKLGQNMRDALETPLDDKELKELGIEVPKEPEKTADKEPEKKDPEKKDPEKKDPEKKDPEKKDK